MYRDLCATMLLTAVHGTGAGETAETPLPSVSEYLLYMFIQDYALLVTEYMFTLFLLNVMIIMF